MAELDLEQRYMENSQGSQHGESWTAAAPRGSAQPRPFGRTLASPRSRRSARLAPKEEGDLPVRTVTAGQ
jgi:hypothetical protein